MTTQIIRQAPYLEDAGIHLLDSVQGTVTSPGLIDRPYVNYNELSAQGLQDPRLAGFSPDQVQSFDLAKSGIGGYKPLLDQSGNTINNIQSNYQAGANTASTLYGQSAGYDANSISKGGQYYNPYQQNVIDSTMTEMNRQHDITRNDQQARVAQSGAFGGARHGVYEAENERNNDQNQWLAVSQLEQQGFQNAQQAQEAHKQRQGIAGQGIARLAQTGANVGLATGQAQAALSQQGQQQNLIDVNTLNAVGGQQQAQLQKQYDINFNQWQDERLDPYRQAAFMSDIIKGTPSASNTYVAGTAAKPSNLAQGVGALTSYASLGQKFGWWGGNTPATP